MADEWQEKTIEEIASKVAMGPFGSDIKTDNFVPAGVPVIRGGNLTQGRFYAKDFVFLTERKADELANANAFPGDIVFTHRGTLGQVGLVPNSPFKRYVVSQSQMKLTCDPNHADPAFIYYFFKSPLGQQALLMNTSQTGVPAISRPTTSLKSIRLSLPPLAEQHAIAHVLGAIDDKIALNRSMNGTLEAMARALFKSWFVDFDPVRAKAEGRETSLPKVLADLFPDAFEESELGEIPRGWSVQTLREIAQVFSGGTPSKGIAEYWNGPLPWISPKAMNGIHVDTSDETVTAAAVGNGTRLVRKGWLHRTLPAQPSP
jgi:type I restriction enzyme S subunit